MVVRHRSRAQDVGAGRDQWQDAHRRTRARDASWKVLEGARVRRARSQRSAPTHAIVTRCGMTTRVAAIMWQSLDDRFAPAAFAHRFVSRRFWCPCNCCCSALTRSTRATSQEFSAPFWSLVVHRGADDRSRSPPCSRSSACCCRHRFFRTTSLRSWRWASTLWAQGNLMVGDYGVLNGQDIDWSGHALAQPLRTGTLAWACRSWRSIFARHGVLDGGVRQPAF